MRTDHATCWLRILAFASALMLVGCDQANVRWSEEVLLNDGQMIVVKRTAQGKTYSELGGTGGWRDPVQMSVSIDPTPGGIKPPPERKQGSESTFLEVGMSQ